MQMKIAWRGERSNGALNKSEARLEVTLNNFFNRQVSCFDEMKAEINIICYHYEMVGFRHCLQSQWK